MINLIFLYKLIFIAKIKKNIHIFYLSYLIIGINSISINIISKYIIIILFSKYAITLIYLLIILILNIIIIYLINFTMDT